MRPLGSFTKHMQANPMKSERNSYFTSIQTSQSRLMLSKNSKMQKNLSHEQVWHKTAMHEVFWKQSVLKTKGLGKKIHTHTFDPTSDHDEFYTVVFPIVI